MDPIMDIGVSAAKDVVQGGLGMLLGSYNDARQLKQQGKLGEQQLGFNKQMVDYNQSKALEMWKATNYGPQVEQMNQAGINPALMYGGSGGGGTTIGNPSGNVSAPNAPAGGREIMDLQLMGAQKRLIEAQTAKTQAEATKTSGIDTAVGEQSLTNMIQGLNNLKAQEELTRTQQQIAYVDEIVKQNTYEDVTTTIRMTAKKAQEELDILRNDKKISSGTVDMMIKKVQGELLGLGLANQMKKAQINLTGEQVEAIKAQVEQAWQKIKIDQKNAGTNAARQALEMFLHDVPDSVKLTVDSIRGVVQSVIK